MKDYKPGELYNKFKLKKKNWIQAMHMKKGALHSELGVAQGNKIPAKKLAGAAKKSGKEGKRARLAETLKSFKHKKAKKMTQAQDDAYDKAHHQKEGSPADIKQDKRNGIKDKKGKKNKTKKKDEYKGMSTKTINALATDRNKTADMMLAAKKVRQQNAKNTADSSKILSGYNQTMKDPKGVFGKGWGQKTHKKMKTRCKQHSKMGCKSCSK